MADLKPANSNPWYVLMTLYGEQVGEHVDSKLHTKNLSAWNQWASSVREASEIETLSRLTGEVVDEKSFWESQEPLISDLHKNEMYRRNGDDFAYPGLPNSAGTYSLTRLQFDNILCLEKFMFFNHIEFYQSQFQRNVHSRRSAFGDAASFLFCNFRKSAVFTGCNFFGPCDFLGSDFADAAIFIEARFGNSANFSRVGFLGNTDFTEAAFAAIAHFQDSVFAAKDAKALAKLEFSDCHFEKPANFLKARFKHKYPNLSGTIMHDRTPFSAEDIYWPSTTPVDLEQAKATCGTIRHLLGKQGLSEDEHYFYRREMEFGTQIGNFWRRLPYRLFGWFSGFGYSIERPVWWLFWLWFIPALLFASAFVTGQVATDVLQVVRASAISLANILNFLGLQKTLISPEALQNLHWALKILSGLQAVFGVVFLFFLGLGLRTRFRLR